MVDPIITPPHPPVSVPQPLPTTVEFNHPMVGTASPFERVDAQNRDLVLEAIRAWARGSLMDWASAWQAGLAAWMGDTNSWLDTWNAEVVRYAQDVMAAVVGNSIVLQDPLMAEIILSDSQARDALNTLYPIFRVWDGTQYPPRIDGALNIFFGPVNPGLAAGPGDQWSNSNTTTVDEVASQVQVVGSALNLAARNAVNGAMILNFGATELRQNPADAALFSLSGRGSGGNQYLSWGIPGTGVSRLYMDFTIPDGWSRMVAEIFYLHNVAAANGLNVGFTPSLTLYTDGSTVPAGTGVTFSDKSLNAGQVKMATSNAWDVTPRQSASLMIARNGSAGAGDTHLNPIEILRIRLRRTA